MHVLIEVGAGCLLEAVRLLMWCPARDLKRSGLGKTLKLHHSDIQVWLLSLFTLQHRYCCLQCCSRATWTQVAVWLHTWTCLSKPSWFDVTFYKNAKMSYCLGHGLFLWSIFHFLLMPPENWLSLNHFKKVPHDASTNEIGEVSLPWHHFQCGLLHVCESNKRIHTQ